MQQLERKHTTPQQIALRARIILLLGSGFSEPQIVQQLGVSRDMVRQWRRRWREQCAADVPVSKRLADAERPGAPGTFTAEQVAQLIAIACEDPRHCGREISHWTGRELADELVKRGIVERISERHVRRLLSEAHLKPHQMRYWELPPKAMSSEQRSEREEGIRQISAVYLSAPERAKQGERTVSTDEKAGIQALERKHPGKPMVPGMVELQEFEYERHGTQTLIASMDLTSGTVETSCGATRKEPDFVLHIQKVVDTHPEVKKWRFVTDRLNTHQSEGLVRLVASYEEQEIDLGVKGKDGILGSMKRRAEYLNEESHRIVFYYTPVHCSWMNQIELWFSILVRKFLKRATFASVDELRERLLAFVDYFNRTMAKPFKWTYKGKALCA